MPESPFLYIVELRTTKERIALAIRGSAKILHAAVTTCGGVTLPSQGIGLVAKRATALCLAGHGRSDDAIMERGKNP